MRRTSRAALGVLALLVVPAACGGESGSPGEAPDALHVVASFYPLQFVVQRIGGDRVSVANLTPVGAEPHEIEMTASNSASLQDADLVVYLAGFSPAVDEAVGDVAGDHAFDVSTAAQLDLTESSAGGGQAGQDPTGTRDPHFWLDPTRLAAVAGAVADQLTAADPADAALFSANAAALTDDLQTLDDEFRTGLARCASTDIVTSHSAFAYVAARYGLTQVGITGLTPEDEPSPADLARVSTFVDEHGVSTIYFETLVSPAIAETVAEETGASTAVLDPLEGLSDTSAGTDYFGVMRANLATLRRGQGCT